MLFDADGGLLTAGSGDTGAFLRDIFASRADRTVVWEGTERPLSYYALTLATEGRTPLIAEFSFISRSAVSEDEPSPLWEGMDAACGLVLSAAMGE